MTVQAVTMDEIAARAGVSRGAVSLALRRSPKISAKTTERILKVARELGYRPNLNASRLARSDYSTIGLLASDLHNPIMADLLDGFALSDPDVDYETYLASGFNSPDRERAAIESFLSHRVKGVVLMGSLLDKKEIQDLSRAAATVVVGRRIEGIDCVLVNDRTGGQLAADHLVGLGHRQIAHIDGGKGAGATVRKNAFRERVRKQAGVGIALLAGDYTQKSGYRGARDLLSLKDRPTGIFAANDLMALGVLGAARELGLVAGRDVSLVGFDDISLAAYDYVSLTTISYSRNDMGRIARELLLRRCADPTLPAEIVELQPSLIIRKSSGESV